MTVKKVKGDITAEFRVFIDLDHQRRPDRETAYYWSLECICILNGKPAILPSSFSVIGV